MQVRVLGYLMQRGLLWGMEEVIIKDDDNYVQKPHIVITFATRQLDQEWHELGVTADCPYRETLQNTPHFYT